MKTTGESQRREQGTEGRDGPSHSSTKNGPASQGHRMPPPHTSPPQPGEIRDTCHPGPAPASPRYLLYKLPPCPPPARLHSDDDALGQPVLCRGPHCLLLLWLDAQPTLQLCDEPLLGRSPAQGGGVQPAARGGLPGHGVCVARLPAPPDHGSDLRVRGGCYRPTLGSPEMLSPHSDAQGKGGQNKTARAEPSCEGQEAGGSQTLPPRVWLTLGKTLHFQGPQLLPP